ncbi:MAG: hypothetical protein U1F26_01245 [Lysobacterales bacterium]
MALGELELVVVEHEWYDGPVSGVAYIDGMPHQFLRAVDEPEGDGSYQFKIWPISLETLAMEIESWSIFVAWNREYEAGNTSLDSHPASGGISERYDQLEIELARYRALPDSARSILGKKAWLDVSERYSESGPGYGFIWRKCGGT